MRKKKNKKKKFIKDSNRVKNKKKFIKNSNRIKNKKNYSLTLINSTEKSIIDKTLNKVIIKEEDGKKIIKFKKGRFSIIEYYKHKSPRFAAFLDFIEKADEAFFRVKK